VRLCQTGRERQVGRECQTVRGKEGGSSVTVSDRERKGGRE
jgi:hypothetical protein